MGLFTKFLAGNLYGSYGETAKTIADTYRIHSGNCKIDDREEVKKLFLNIAHSRYSSAIQVGLTKGNRLKDFNWDLSYTSYLISNMESTDQFYNLPTFAFILMYFESLQKRQELRDGEILLDVLKVIYEETNITFDKQTLLSFEDYSRGIRKSFNSINMSSEMLDSMEPFFP